METGTYSLNKKLAWVEVDGVDIWLDLMKPLMDPLKHRKQKNPLRDGYIHSNLVLKSLYVGCFCLECYCGST